MDIRVPYGRSLLTASIPDRHRVDIIEAPEPPPAADPTGTILRALENLLGEAHWGDWAGARSVGIAINDKTRPVPHAQLLPPLMEHLAALGIPDGAITFHIAVGSHPPMRAEELPAILPDEILSRYQVVSHDADDEELLIDLGQTRGGTPIRLNKAYLQSDFKIVVGNIEPHQFAGFSGGVKSAAIGLAGRKTITHNHALMTHPEAQLGTYETNPARQDIEEIGKKMGIQLAYNAILNPSRAIMHVLAGEPRAVMQAGIPLARQAYQAEVPHPYGLTISSPGGHPKDINLYQAQKGLAHAALITRPGGTVILVAACPEGTGSLHYEAWMKGKQSQAEVMACFQAEGFSIGPHKAYQIARDASQVRLMFCSEMDTAFARALLLNPVNDLQTAINLALSDLQPGERIGILPHASATIPTIHR